jgi:hypothetical protein
MSSLRSVIFAIALFAGSYLGAQWIIFGAPLPISTLRVVPLEPSSQVPTFAERNRTDYATLPSRRIDDNHPADRGVPLPQRRYDVPRSREEIDRERRRHYRDAALAALRRPGPALCGPTERGNFVAIINQYYSLRQTAERSSASLSRAEQAEARSEWASPVDLQIDGLVRNFYAEGYLRPGDLPKSPTLEQVLSGITWTGRACPDATGS